MSPVRNFTANYFQQYIPENNRDLVITFIIVFSRFEYALKAEGFINGDENGVTANWDTFANSIREHFQPNRTRELQTSVKFLHQSPPRKQIKLENNQLGWSQPRNLENQPQLHELLLSVRTIRNNLFHGAKFQEIFQENQSIDRNQLLLQYSLVVLNECLRLSPQIQQTFFAEIPIRNQFNNENDINE
ncbi:MAG: hypothetical protein Q8T08_01345 [Ignavibacteria bacterium]|nr:hypothetical protein [Ignavibacteria bacterium]